MRNLFFLITAGWLCLALAACNSTGANPAVVQASVAETATLTPTFTASATPSATPSPVPPTATGTPTATPTATPCAETLGTTTSISLTSVILHYPIDARLYLPPCYAATQQRYPVLYLVHGLNYTERQWEDLGIITATNALIASGEIAPFIMVLPRDRLDERWDPAFVQDLVPYIDQHYRTLTDRAHRALGGLSRGAGWAVHLGLHYPETFGRIGIHSPAVFYGDEQKLINWSWHMPPDLQPALYLDIGENDSLLHSAVWLDQIFTWYKLPHTYLLQPGTHSAKYWSTHLPEYLRFYAGAWRPTPTPTPTLFLPFKP